MGVSKCMGVYEHQGGIWTPHKPDNPIMIASKVGTSYLKLTIPLDVLPSYFSSDPIC